MRRLLFPVIVTALIALPILISQSRNANRPSAQPENAGTHQASGGRSPFAFAGYQQPVASPATNGPVPIWPSSPNAPGANMTFQPGILPGAVSGLTPGTTSPATWPTVVPQTPPPLFAADTGTIVFPGSATGPDLYAAPMEFLPTQNLGEIFRFDLTPASITQRWKRVSTGPSSDQLQSMRVALVTGTNPNDLHGSLTYHFDNRQQLQRITFRGWAGTTQPLSDFLQQHFDFSAHPSRQGSMMLSKSFMKTRGAMLSKFPQVISAANPNQQVAIVLELNNPNGRPGVSHEMATMINAMK